MYFAHSLIQTSAEQLHLFAHFGLTLPHSEFLRKSLPTEGPNLLPLLPRGKSFFQTWGVQVPRLLGSFFAIQRPGRGCCQGD